MNAAVFHQAVADGDATRVKFLINIGQQARVNQRNKKGYTSLQQSSKDGMYEVVEVLLSHGANTEAVDKKGRTALHLASAGGYLDIVKLLIASCADINAKDHDGKLAIEVAKRDEIKELLRKTSEGRQAKNPETNKKVLTEDWTQNVTSLPAGSRNSLVSNSSSDSGVFTEDNLSVRSADCKLIRANGYISSARASRNENRVMGVLDESDEHLYESGRERSRTVHEMRNTIDEEQFYEQPRERSKTFGNPIRVTSLEQNWCELRENGKEEILHAVERSEIEFATHLSTENATERNQHEMHLIAQASMKMAHHTRPQPKLRRSMSERLPARQRKQLKGRRDISEELAALNLYRQSQNRHYYLDLNHRDFRSTKLPTIPEPQSPNEDLGYGGEIPNDFDEFEQSSAPNYYMSSSNTLPRNRARGEEFYPPREEAWKEAIRDEYVCGEPQLARPKSNDIHADFTRDDDYTNDVACYQRAQPKYLSGLLGQTNDEDRYLSTGARNYTQQRIGQRHFQNSLSNKNFTLQRRDSACSDTGIASYRRKMLQNSEDYIDYSRNRDYSYYQEQDYSRSLPSYEETLQRKRLGSETRHSAQRLISQV